jgi:hypothetical protein
MVAVRSSAGSTIQPASAIDVANEANAILIIEKTSLLGSSRRYLAGCRFHGSLTLSFR